MSLEALKKEAAALDEVSKRELLQFLLSLREQNWAVHARAVASRLDDSSPGRWMTLEEVRAGLDEIPEPTE